MRILTVFQLGIEPSIELPQRHESRGFTRNFVDLPLYLMVRLRPDTYEPVVVVFLSLRRLNLRQCDSRHCIRKRGCR